MMKTNNVRGRMTGFRGTLGSSGGFTLIELLVVIAIISILVGMLLAGLEEKRKAFARAVSMENLENLSLAAKSFRDQEGRFPNDLMILIDFCKLYPPLCSQVEADILASGQHEGYRYFIDALSAEALRIGAEPAHPGRTGSETFFHETTRLEGRYVSRVSSVPTPGAAAEREEMFASIRDGGAHTIAELLKLDPVAPFAARDFVGAADAQQIAVEILDQNADGHVSLAEIFDWPGAYARRFDGIDPAIEVPVRQFLELVHHEMRLDTSSPDQHEQTMVPERIAFSPDLGSNLFSLSQQCDLTKRLVTDEKVSRQLCLELKKAGDAIARGDLRAAERHLASYQRGVDAETHRTLTDWNTRTLQAWLTAGFFELTHGSAPRRAGE